MFRFLIIAIMTFVTGMLAEIYILYYLSYFFLGIFLLLKIYHYHLVNYLELTHKVIDTHIFPEEYSSCRIEFSNQGYLPILWLKVEEILPVKLTSRRKRGVLFLRAGETRKWYFQLEGGRRGIYQLGPLHWKSGDILGYREISGSLPRSNYLLVYPRILSLEKLGLPSRLPHGNIKWPRPVYKDSTRVKGIRDYHPGDSVKKIHWKVTARTGKLMVKEYESTIALETTILLNMNLREYGLKRLGPRIELAVTAAASIASYLARVRYPFELVTNGQDPWFSDKDILTSERGQGERHLQEVLELLARLEVTEDKKFTSIFKNEFNFAWGTTMVIITEQDTEELIKQLMSLRNYGFNIEIFIVGDQVIHKEYLKRPFTSQISIYRIKNEEDLYRL